MQERHASGLGILDRMLQDSDGESEHGRRLSLGLFEEEHVWAVAVAEVSVRRGLQVRSLAVNPSQLHLTDSTTYQRMLHARRCMSGRGLVREAASQPMPHHVPPGVPWSSQLVPQPSHSLGPHAARLVPSTATPRHGPRWAAELSVRLLSRRAVLTRQARPESPGRGDLRRA